MESELFGHEKGAFTGAVERPAGLFELANGGTLFLDEIGEIPSADPGQMLRVLDDSRSPTARRPKRIQLDVRVSRPPTAISKRSWSAEHFRQDLFYRLNVFRRPDAAAARAQGRSARPLRGRACSRR